MYTRTRSTIINFRTNTVQRRREMAEAPTANVSSVGMNVLHTIANFHGSLLYVCMCVCVCVCVVGGKWLRSLVRLIILIEHAGLINHIGMLGDQNGVLSGHFLSNWRSYKSLFALIHPDK